MAGAQPNIGPDGVLYPSIRAACKKFSKGERPVYKRMKQGMTLAQAIQDSPGIDANAVMYKGRKYKNLTALCDACSAPYAVVYDRLRKGIPLGSAMETPFTACGVSDAFGTEYKSARALCQDWDISRDVFSYHLRNGHDSVTAMSMAACAKWPGTQAGPYIIVKCVQWPWFLCQDPDRNEIILHARKIRHFKNKSKQPDPL